MMKNCLNCDTEFEQPKGKREKRFCSDTCRASFSQKQKIKEKEPPQWVYEYFKKYPEKLIIAKSREVVVQDLTESNVEKKPKEQKKTNYVANNNPKIKHYDYTAMPLHLSYSGREAWKKKARAEQDNQ